MSKFVVDESKLFTVGKDKIPCSPSTLEILGYLELEYTISEKVRQFMKENNYTKADIAKITKTSPKTVAKILRGTKKLELEFIYRFLRRLTNSPKLIIEIFKETEERISDL